MTTMITHARLMPFSFSLTIAALVGLWSLAASSSFATEATEATDATDVTATSVEEPRTQIDVEPAPAAPVDEAPADDASADDASGNQDLAEVHAEELAPDPVPVDETVAADPVSDVPVGFPSAVPSEDQGARDSTEQTIASVLSESDPELKQLEAQILAGEYDIPKAWLQAKIDQIEDTTHRFNPDLVRPVTLLGDILVQQGDYDGALDHYNRAVHVERVSSGLVSPGQVEIVYREAQVYRSLGDFAQANEREEYAYHVLRRSHSPYDEDLLPGVFHLARWYQRTHNIFAARSLYQRAADIYTANGKGGSLETIPALEGLATTYKLERFPPFYIGEDGTYGSTLIPGQGLDGPIMINNFPAGERALQSIVQIQRAHEVDVVIIAESILNLADWYLLFEKARRASALYEHVYYLFKGVEDFDVVGYFAEPKMLHYPAPGDPREPPAQARYEEALGYVELAYDVSEEGSVRKLRTVASDPEGMMDFRVRKSVRAARYRPVVIDGVPVATHETFRHEFTYYPELELADSQSTEAGRSEETAQ